MKVGEERLTATAPPATYDGYLEARVATGPLPDHRPPSFKGRCRAAHLTHPAARRSASSSLPASAGRGVHGCVLRYGRPAAWLVREPSLHPRGSRYGVGCAREVADPLIESSQPGRWPLDPRMTRHLETTGLGVDMEVDAQ